MKPQQDTVVFMFGCARRAPIAGWCRYLAQRLCLRCRGRFLSQYKAKRANGQDTVFVSARRNIVAATRELRPPARDGVSLLEEMMIAESVSTSPVLRHHTHATATRPKSESTRQSTSRVYTDPLPSSQMQEACAWQQANQHSKVCPALHIFLWP